MRQIRVYAFVFLLLVALAMLLWLMATAGDERRLHRLRFRGPFDDGTAYAIR